MDSTRAMARPGGTAGVTLREVGLTRVWNVRGNASDASFVAEVGRLFGAPLPAEPLCASQTAEGVWLWLGPRSWLFVGAPSAARDGFDVARRAIVAAGGALFDLSASYVAWAVAGPAAGRVLNRGCPLDFHPQAFPPQRCAQSLLGHVAALFYRPRLASEFVVMVARSFAADAWSGLCTSAGAEGFRVASPVPFERLAESAGTEPA